MTVQELDRLVSKTNLSPVTKEALKVVRRAVIRGNVGDPDVGTASWSVSVDNEAGREVRMAFSFKRDS